MIAKAERHGLTPTAKLVEYVAFIVSGTIKLKPMIVANFHFRQPSRMGEAAKAQEYFVVCLGLCSCERGGCQ